jgi:hypothetical protein
MIPVSNLEIRAYLGEQLCPDGLDIGDIGSLD